MSLVQLHKYGREDSEESQKGRITAKGFGTYFDPYKIRAFGRHAQT